MESLFRLFTAPALCVCVSQATAVTYSLCSSGPWAARAVLISTAGAQLRPAWRSEHIYVHVELTFSIFNQVSEAQEVSAAAGETKPHKIYGCVCVILAPEVYLLQQ